ncbi:MAG: glycosyltransferase family 39 protein [Bacteroidia bacterium]|nr:glycosyltransferase family 39 protein [Bacteroidia bacterium]
MSSLKIFFSDIRSWILLFFLLRLFAITDPPLEAAHNWRQTTVTMAARNFYETGPELLYPRIDICGEKTGITGMEFPLLNYLIFLVSKVFGYAHWYGRLINLIVSCFGLWFFYRLVLKYFSPGLAFKATYLLILSVWFTYSRKIMPDTFSMSFLLAGFYYGSNYLDGIKKNRNLILYGLLVLLGVLSKLPSGYFLILFSPIVLGNNTGRHQKVVFVGVSVFIGVIISAYYFYWVPYITNFYGLEHFFMGKSITQGLSETLQNLDEFADKFYMEALGVSGFLIFVAGLVLAIVKKNKRLLLIFTLALAAFFVVILKSGFAFYHHTYYIIPFAPIMALVAAYALENIRQIKWAYVLLAVYTAEAIPSKNHDFYIKEQNLAILQLEETLDKVSSRKDLILINSGNLPTPIYFAHRKGWVDSNEKLQDTAYINNLKQKGLKYIVLLKRAFGTDLTLSYPEVVNNVNFRVYKL